MTFPPQNLTPWDVPLKTYLDTVHSKIVEPVQTYTVTTTATVTLADVTTAAAHRVTMQSNGTLALPAAQAGKSIVVVVVQDATGSRTVGWTGTVKWLGGGGAPAASTTANAVDKYVFDCFDGTNWLGAQGKGYA